MDKEIWRAIPIPEERKTLRPSEEYEMLAKGGGQESKVEKMSAAEYVSVKRFGGTNS